MDGYIPLASRVRGACHCPLCSSNPEIAKFYVNDVLCKYDGLVCTSFDDSGRCVCFQKYRGRVFYCSRFPSARLGRL